MKKLSRRSFVQTLARGAMLGAAAPLFSSLAGCGGDRVTLNVVLHGLFIMNITDSQIELLTPYVVEHYYGAGSWTKDGICSLGKYDISMGKHGAHSLGKAGNCPPDDHGNYQLTGTDFIAEMPPLGSDANLTLSQSQYNFTIHRDKTFFTILLPFPQRMGFLRRVLGKDNQLPTGGASAVINNFALCPALVYPVKDYRDLKLTGTRWKPYVDPETRTVNLHLWAEPLKKLTPQHATMAFEKLSDLTCPVKVQLGTQAGAPLDRYPCVYGVASEEEQGLAEWISGGETSHPTNCNVVITTT
jgi:hypothetical protein